MTGAGGIVVGGLDLLEALERWGAHWRGPGARVSDVRPMPGNAGLSFGFRIAPGDGTVTERLVIRLSPPGAPRSDNTDVLRQVPLLHALAAAGVPVAPLVWSTDDTSWFGADAIVQRFLPALPLHLSEPSAGVDPSRVGVEAFVRSALTVLADIHQLAWSKVLPGGAEPADAANELARWSAVLGRADNSAWTAGGEALAAALRRRVPPDAPVGLLHGDFQTNNVLYDADGTVRAVIDWELAGVGLQGLDVGWMAMMTDPSFWSVEHRREMRVVADSAQILAWYEQERGARLSGFDWYRALAAFRFGSIVAYNLRLHRSGRRVDATYETLARSVDPLFRRGLQLLEGLSTTS